jgi:hypothetical protein
MIFKVGQYGIVKFSEPHNSFTDCEAIIVHKGINFLPKIEKGYLRINMNGLCLHFNDENQMLKVFEMINDILTGTRQEKLERILKDDVI